MAPGMFDDLKYLPWMLLAVVVAAFLLGGQCSSSCNHRLHISIEEKPGATQ